VKGGAELAAVRHAEALARQGWMTDLVVARSAPEQIAIPDGVRAVRLGASRAHRSLPALCRYLRDERPGIVIAHQRRVARIALLADLLGASSAPTVAVEHSMFSRDRAHWNPMIRPWLAGVTATLYQRAAALVHVSDCAARDLEIGLGLPAGTVRTMYNPVAVTAGERRSEGPSGGGVAEDRIAYVGRLVPEKDVTTLIQAFRSVLATHPDLRLDILGDGPDRERLHRRVESWVLQDRIVFHGYVGDPAPMVRDSRLLVLSSRQEALPTVLIEALALGTPVVSTSCPCGPAEILAGGRFGVLVPVGSVEGLAEGIREALARDWDRDALIRRASRFSVGIVGEEWTRLLEELLSTRTSGSSQVR
jgi:glycosyltransferase involved in cell wall biosynthesis